MSARPPWCGRCAPDAGWSNWTAPRWARCAPRTGSDRRLRGGTVRDGGGVLLITDIDALLPATAEPVATLILTELRTAVATPGVAFVATSAVPDALDPGCGHPTCATASSA